MDRLRSVKPSHLFLAIDGPRGAADEAACTECRSAAQSIDWPCRVHTLFREENLGCERAINEALDWFFEQVPCGIILEDDCLPDISFFRFCEEMLERYAADLRVFQVSGRNEAPDRRWSGNASYFFSRYGGIWGWATWADRWQRHVKRRELTSEELSAISEYTEPGFGVGKRIELWKSTQAGQIDTWDIQWWLTRALEHGLAVVPETNLVENIGFGKGAHSTSTDQVRHRNEVGEISFPLRHPETLHANLTYDREFCLINSSGEAPRRSLKTRLLQRFPALGSLK